MSTNMCWYTETLFFCAVELSHTIRLRCINVDSTWGCLTLQSAQETSHLPEVAIKGAFKNVILHEIDLSQCSCKEKKNWHYVLK